MDKFFSIFASLLFIQSILALFATMRFTRYALRQRPTRQTRYQPKAVVIVPCRGLEHGFEENIHAILTQDYRDYEVVFVTESENDPAHGVLARLLKQRRRLSPPTWMVVAGEARNQGQKVHNLLSALDTLNSIGRVEALVFADSDMRPARNWLTELVAPLGDHRVGATTGYRWYLPSNERVEGRNLAQSFASTLLSVWNASALALLGERSGFAWGGSMAIRRENFDEIGVKERWQGALSDDYVLTSAVQEQGQRIKFAPQCLVASRSEATVKDLFEFTTRQMRITRVYSPRVWRLACVSHGLFNLTFWGGLLWLVISSLTRTPSRPLAILLAGVFLLGAVTGAMRAVVAARLLGAGHVRKWWAYLSLGPVVSLVYLYNVIASAKTTRIVWRDIAYDLISPSETVILHRPAQRGQTGKVARPRKRPSSAPSSSQKR
ncbi:MAG TPA: glycosyltransferase [Blastocatellia bacterium]|nr:glycosyltransferase [Blastocatellia bacterium]